MKLIWLGSGAAFTMANRQSNAMLEHDNGTRLLIDCGSDVRHSLLQVGLTAKNITDVYLSHLHADHVGGLEWLAFSTRFDPSRKKKPVLYVNRFLRADLWNKVLAGGLSSIQGEPADINSFFEVASHTKDGKFVWEDVDFQMVQTVHIMDGFQIVPSFGLMFEVNGVKVFITTDTQHCPEQIKDFYNMADVIFQDCETAPFCSRVHAHYSQLCTLDPVTKAKMWLYHYQDGKLPNAKEDGFRGFVQQRQVFDFIDTETLFDKIVIAPKA